MIGIGRLQQRWIPESIIFEYDIDSTQSASDVLVKIDARDVLTDTWYQTVVVDQYIVNQADADEFDSVFTVPEQSQGLYEFDVVLYLDGKPLTTTQPSISSG